MTETMYFLWCSDHDGLVPREDITISVGEETGYTFLNCTIHPDAEFKMYTQDNINEIYGLHREGWAKFK